MSERGDAEDDRVVGATRPGWRRRVPVVAGLMVAAYVAAGLPQGSLGVAWPSMRETFDRPLSGLGLVLVVMTVGYLLATASHGTVVGRVGTGGLFVGAAAVASVGAIAFAAAPVWPVLLLGGALVGLGGGVIDAGLNSYVALNHSPRLLNLMHGGFGIGATGGPLAMTALVGAGVSWRVGFGAMAAVQVATACGFWLTRGRWRTGATRSPDGSDLAGPIDPRDLAEPDPDEPVEPDAPVPRHGVIVGLSMSAFFAYNGVEIAVSSWAFTLLTARGLSTAGAGLATTLYWAALTGGRLTIGAAGHRVTPPQVLVGSMVGVLAGGALLWLGPVGLAPFALAVLGAGLAGVFPAMVALTPARVGEHRAPSVIGYQLAAAGIGGAAIPALVGIVGQRLGAEAIGPALAVACAALVVTYLLLTGASPHREALH